MHMSESGLSVNLRRYARYSFRTSLDKFKRGNGFNWCPMSVNPRLKKINSIRCLNKTLQPNNIRSPRKKPLNKSKKSPN